MATINKDAFDIAKEWYNDDTTTKKEKALLERMFPQLKESEDERVLKIIKETLKSYNGGVIFGSLSARDYTDCLAWLEKKGEKKPQRIVSAEAKEAMYDKPTWSEEDEKTIDEAVECLENYVEYVQGGFSKQHVLDLASRVESLKDRYFWKPSDEQMEYLSAAIEESNENPVIESLYKDLKKLREE